MSINGIGRPRAPGFAVGTQLAHVTVIKELPQTQQNGYLTEHYLCRCACGRAFTQRKMQLRSNPDVRCKSCAGKVAAVTRGSDGRTRTPEWDVWRSMIQRCNNPNAQAYHNYGGRGITVCKSWHTFENFLLDMGYRPPGGTLERVKNNKGYTPRNCVWASDAEQRRNTRSNRWLTVNGDRQLISEWARRLGTTNTVISLRISKWGWSVEAACTTPIKPRANRKFFHA